MQPEGTGKLVQEAIPKFAHRAIDATLDSQILNRVKELRGSLTSLYKTSGNFGYAETSVSGLSRKEFFAHSSIDSKSFKGDLPSRVPDISLEPTNPVFDALEVNSDNVINGKDAYTRFYDSEYKILNDIASKLGNKTDASGTIKLFTDRETCPSCARTVNQFMEKYKNIKVEVVHNSGEILK